MVIEHLLDRKGEQGAFILCFYSSLVSGFHIIACVEQFSRNFSVGSLFLDAKQVDGQVPNERYKI